MTISLSAIMIAKNEERDLPGCLESLKGLANEIVIVVSDDTTDKTEEIAKAAGAKVLRRKFDNYAQQRQASLDAAAGEWCLWIDPDERVSEPLKLAIGRVLSGSHSRAGEITNFWIKFDVRFLGRNLRWGGLGSERHLRLFKRNGAKFVGGELHESIQCEGMAGLIQDKIVHTPYRDVADYMSKLERYTDLGAQKRFAAGKRFTAFHHLIYPWELFSRLVLKLGILDGGPGLIWARLSAYHSWLKYVKLGRMQRENK